MSESQVAFYYCNLKTSITVLPVSTVAAFGQGPLETSVEMGIGTGTLVNRDSDSPFGTRGSLAPRATRRFGTATTDHGGTGPARRGAAARAAGWGRRDFIHSANPPCVPYLGVYLTDLTFIEDGIPDKIKHTTAAGDDGASAGRIAATQTKPNLT